MTDGIDDVVAGTDTGIEVDEQAETDWSIYINSPVNFYDPETDGLVNEDIFPELVENGAL